MSVEIAEKIIKKEISQAPELLLDSVNTILKGLSKDEEKIMIKASPLQADILKSEVPETARNLGLDAKIVIVGDDSIMDGGCIVTTTNGVVDATIETQLAIISEALKEV